MQWLQLLRNTIPRKVLTAWRFVSIFNRDHGHSSRDRGLCLDGKGKPIPWITYPCLEFLSGLDFAGCIVFEYGSGSSTLWWSGKASEVYSVEREPDWHARIQPSLPSNATVALCPDETRYASAILDIDRFFDVVVIDGAVRYPCAQAMLPKLKLSGLVILDNTEWYPGLARFLRDSGFQQIDFSGFGPINAFASCTSIFFRDPAMLSRRLDRPGWAPVGGRFLEAHDDKPLKDIDPNILRNSTQALETH